MKIYSNVIPPWTLGVLGKDLLQVFTVPIKVPRIRRQGYLVTASGNTTRWKNTGKHGASDLRAASWDQHGQWFARIFDRDPAAVIVANGRYDGREDFHAKTSGRYK